METDFIAKCYNGLCMLVLREANEHGLRVEGLAPETRPPTETSAAATPSRKSAAATPSRKSAAATPSRKSADFKPKWTIEEEEEDYDNSQ